MKRIEIDIFIVRNCTSEPSKFWCLQTSAILIRFSNKLGGIWFTETLERELQPSSIEGIG
jgi:hypothetical protein